MKKHVYLMTFALLFALQGCKPKEAIEAEQASADAVVQDATVTTEQATQAPADIVLLDQLVQEYYLKPEQETIPKIMQLLDEYIARQGKGALPGVSAPMLGFFSQVFKNNPAQLKIWQTTLLGLTSRELKLVLLNALCFANNDEARSILTRHTDEFPELKTIQFNQEPPDLMELPLEAPELLDMTWGAFFATGDLAFVKRILDVACTPEKDKGVNLTVRTALWSIVSNASRHTRLRRFVNETLSAVPNETLRTFVKPLTLKHRQALFNDDLLLKANILQMPPKVAETVPKNDNTISPKN